MTNKIWLEGGATVHGLSYYLNYPIARKETKMTREEYNRRAEARRNKSILIKGSLGIAAFLMFAGIVGKSDVNTYNGIHFTKGIVSESGNILADNGRSYKAKGFQSGSEVTVKLDKKGNILSVVSK